MTGTGTTTIAGGAATFNAGGGNPAITATFAGRDYPCDLE